MKKRIVLVIGLMIVLIGLFGVASEVKSVEASGTIYIRADGSIDPPTAPISSVDNVTYTFTDNINDSIVVERDNIVVDGAGYTVQGTESGVGIQLWYTNNVTIENTQVKAFWVGIHVASASNNTISGNTITDNGGNGIELSGAMYESSDYNTIYGNNITENGFNGISFGSYSSNNKFYHNNIINNTKQVYHGGTNVWDNGYPSGGNYWSDYTGEDTKNGVLNPVLFVHMLEGSSSDWDWMIDKLVSDGWPREILYAFTFSFPSDSEPGANARNAGEIVPWMNQILAETGAEKVDLVSHSMGGLSTRHYIKFLDGIDKVDDYVSLGSNHHGTTLSGVKGSDTEPDSAFLENLNDGDETPGGVLPDTEGWRDDPVGEGGYNGTHVPGDITWTSIRSNIDPAIIPPESAILDGAVNLERSIGHMDFLTDEQVYEWVKAAIEEGDGIGDATYVIDANNRDSYPLMGPFNTFYAGTWNGATYSVDVVTNSTVSDLYFNPDEGPFIRINVSGLNNTTGFSRVAVPKQLLWVEEGQWVVLVGGESVVSTVTEDADYTYLYFTYSHSTKTVQITGTHVIPEFPTLTSMLLILIVLTGAIVFYKRRLPKTPIH